MYVIRPDHAVGGLTCMNGHSDPADVSIAPRHVSRSHGSHIPKPQRSCLALNGLFFSSLYNILNCTILSCAWPMTGNQWAPVSDGRVYWRET